MWPIMPLLMKQLTKLPLYKPNYRRLTNSSEFYWHRLSFVKTFFRNPVQKKDRQEEKTTVNILWLRWHKGALRNSNTIVYYYSMFFDDPSYDLLYPILYVIATIGYHNKYFNIVIYVV